jgi:hypothetical protein
MSFKSFWLVKLGKFTIWNQNSLKDSVVLPDMAEFHSDVYIYDGISLSSLCRFLTEKFRQYEIEFKYLEENFVQIFVPNNRELTIVGHFATLMHKNDKNFRIGEDEVHLQFDFNSLKEIITKKITFKHEDSNKCFVNFTKLCFVENLFVYTNIIEDVCISEDKKKLLKIVPVTHGNDFSNNVIFINPHYVPIENDFIERIRMSVTDAQGEDIKFVDIFSNIIYKLHFRPKQY